MQTKLSFNATFAVVVALFGLFSQIAVAAPTITAPLQARFTDTSVGSTGTYTLNVKATDLTEDITLQFDDNPPFSAAVTSISKDAAMTTEGYDLTLRFTPTAAGSFGSRLTMTSSGVVRYVTLNGIGIASSSKPEIIISNNKLNFDKVNVGESRTITVNIKGVGLTRGITVVPNFAFKASTEWITPEEAMSPDGYDFSVTFAPTEPGLKSGNIMLSSSGAGYAQIQCNGTGVAVEGTGITVSPSSVTFPQYTVGNGAFPTQTITVKASGITSDITVGGLAAPFKTSVSTISKEAAMSASGYELTVSYEPTEAGQHYGQLTLTSGAYSAKVSLTAMSIGVSGIKYATAIQNLADGEECVYTGTATVTFVDFSEKCVYAQDLLGGMCLNFQFFNDINLKPGDEVSNISGFVTKVSGANQLCVFSPDYIVTASGKSIVPVTISASELNSSLLQNVFKLVTVENVDFGENAGTAFSSISPVQGNAGATKIDVMPFASTTADGEEVPPTATVTGISVSPMCVSLRPRSAEDLVYEPTETPFIQVDRTEVEFEGEANEAHTETFVVEGHNLTDNIDITVSGADADKFNVTPSVLPVVGGEFTLTFLAEEEGVYEAEIQLSSNNASTAISVTARNKPSTSVEEVLTVTPSLKARLIASTLIVDAMGEISRLSVHGIDGTLLLSDTPASATATYDVAALGKRVVILTAIVADGTTVTVKLSL